MTYKEVFQLAQEKGYKLNYPNTSILTGETLECMVLLELTLIQKWLRDEHKIFLSIVAKGYSEYAMAYKYEINKPKGREFLTTNPIYQTYEDALLNGINEALKLI